MSEELKYNEPWILQRADPYVYRHTDGNYYFTASIPAYDLSLIHIFGYDSSFFQVFFV